MNYKIVCVKDGKYYSYTKNIASNYSYLQNWIVEYKLNEWVQPRIKNSLLFYLQSMKDARNYIDKFINTSSDLFDCNYNYNFLLFECKVKKSLFIPGWAVTSNRASELHFFWNDILKSQNLIYKSKTKFLEDYKTSYKPMVFGMAEEIMLTKLVVEI
jgi:hypothetical protein